MIKKIIKIFTSKEQKFCFEKHNLLLWYFSIEHPCPPVSINEENPFFKKYGFLILRDVEKLNPNYKNALDFLLQTTPDIINCKTIFGKKKIYFKDKDNYIQLKERDILFFNPKKVSFFI